MAQNRTQLKLPPQVENKFIVTAGTNYTKPLRTGMCCHDSHKRDIMEYNTTRPDELLFRVQLQFSKEL